MIGAAIKMRPSTRIHCVISHFSTTKALQGTRARHARFPLTSSNISPSVTYYQHTSLHHSLSNNAQSSRKQALSLTQPISRSPAASTQSQPAPSPSHTYSSRFSTKTSVMSSDDAYMSFLDKANGDLNAGRATKQGADTARTETVDATTKIPTPLQSVDSYYISDTDEPFEPVALLWKGAKQGVWPSPDQLSRLISPNADLGEAISTLSASSFDPKNQYTSALRAVRSAAVEHDEDADQSAVEVKVYRVDLSSTKLEYWVLALDVPEGRVVGLRAKAVES